MFVPLPGPTIELISRGSSLVLISCIEIISRRRCISQRRLPCHLQCQRPCRFLRRAGPCAVPGPALTAVPLLVPTAVPFHAHADCLTTSGADGRGDAGPDVRHFQRQRPSCLLRRCSCHFQCQPLSTSPEEVAFISCIERTSRRRCLSQRRLSCHLQCQRPCRFLRRAGPCADGRAATRADCSAVPRAP